MLILENAKHTQGCKIKCSHLVCQPLPEVSSLPQRQTLLMSSVALKTCLYAFTHTHTHTHTQHTHSAQGVKHVILPLFLPS